MRSPTLVTAALFLSTLVASAQAPAHVFDIRTYGAKGDGATINTAAINAAIDAASAAGGGTVFFPAGEWLSYSIHLKSNITLYLDSGCVLTAAEPSADLSVGYDPPEPNPVTDQYEDFGHSHWHNSFIWGEDLTDVAIIGPGMIFGKGLSRGHGPLRRDLLPEERAQKPDKSYNAKFPELRFPAETIAAIEEIKSGPFGYPGHDTLPAGVGNKAIALKNCRNVIMRDFTIYHGGHFAILATGVQNWTCDGLKIDTNRDGIDFDCSQNVRVSNCTINSPYDDGICPKASFGLGRVMPTENITITNCQVSGFDEGTLLDGTRQRKVLGRPGHGRIKFGTEANGGFRNVTISNCIFEYCKGLALESVDGGLLEDFTISNITMRDIGNSPIYLRLGARLRGPAPIEIGAMRRIKIDTIVAHNAPIQGGIMIVGEPEHPIEDLTLSNIFIDFVGGGTREQAAVEVPAQERNRYPDPEALGTMPAWGVFARHAKNISFDRVELRAQTPDLRPVAQLIDVSNATFTRVKFPAAPDTKTFVLKGVTGLTIDDSPGIKDTERPGTDTDDSL